MTTIELRCVTVFVSRLKAKIFAQSLENTLCTLDGCISYGVGIVPLRLVSNIYCPW